MKQILFIFLSSLIYLTLSQSYGPNGIYVGVSDVLLRDSFSQITSIVANTFNQYSIPDQSGSASSGSYTFSSFQQTLVLDEMFISQTGVNTYDIGWRNIGFNIQWNYHICAGGIFNPCEDGNVDVYTDSNSTDPVIITTSVIFDYSTSPVTFQATATTMQFNSGTVEIYVQCTNAVCVIPVDDIASDIANSFVPTVTTAVTNAANEMAPKVLSYWVPTSYELKYSYNGDNFFLDLTGSIVESSNRSELTPTQTLQFVGTSQVNTAQGTTIVFPYPPQFTPDASTLEVFASDVLVTLSPYIFESLAFLPYESVLPLTLTPSEVPDGSPVHLNTSDPFFAQVAPGLSNYPNLGIEVVVSTNGVAPYAEINSTGVSISNILLSAQFNILDSPSPIEAFVVNFDISVDINSQAIIQSSQILSLNSSIVAFWPLASIASTNVGDVDPSGFVQVLQMFPTILSIPIFTIEVPSSLTLLEVETVYLDNVVQLELNVDFNIVDY